MGGAINRLKDIELKRRNGVKRDKEETLSDGCPILKRKSAWRSLSYNTTMRDDMTAARG
ncbi:TPA: hypothetical protein ACHIES_001344 [Escherichia coli]